MEGLFHRGIRVTWFGLNWWDILLNTAVLAAIPLLLAAWGGHLAAEAITDPKNKRKVKACFWLLFAFGVVATFWQQFRSAQSDLEKDTNTKFAMAVAVQRMYPPPASPLIEEKLTPTPPRSYLGGDGEPKFLGRSAEGVAGSNFQVGDALGFNVYYRSSGPNAIYIGSAGRMVVLEPDDSPESLKEAYKSFESELKAEGKTNLDFKETWTQVTPDTRRFDSAYAFDGELGHPVRHVVTQTDLDRLRSGSEVAVIISYINYKDAGRIHQFWNCMYLQPPSQPPGIWHYFGGVCPDSH